MYIIHHYIYIIFPFYNRVCSDTQVLDDLSLEGLEEAPRAAKKGSRSSSRR